MHARQTRLHEVQHAKQIDIEQILEILVGVVQKGFGAVDAGVVDQDVNAAPLRLHALHRLHTGLTVAHIHAEGHHPIGRTTPGLLQGLQFGCVGGHQRHPRALFQVGLGNGAANAATRARDERHLVV